MTTTAVIPARGGSKGVPGKNLALVGGRSLIERAVDACRRARRIDRVIVSTDDDAIAEEAERVGALVVRRPAELAGDTASSEAALLHALDELAAGGTQVDVIAFVQCTSPFIDPVDLDHAIETVVSGRADVSFAARPSYEFVWTDADDGSLVGLNHDHLHRARRQDRAPHWVETGAFYVFGAAGLREHRHRFFGRVAAQPVDATRAVEIDTPAELEVARLLAAGEVSIGAAELGSVRLLVTDFDGVHTDDRVWITADGTEAVVASRRDGHGIKMLRRHGIEVLILSTESNPVVARRAEKLNVECIQAVDDKWPRLRKLLDERGIDPSHVAYLGNDVNDLDCLANVGVGIATADADPAAHRVATARTVAAGGRGAVREVAEWIVAAVTGPDHRGSSGNADDRGG